jgi:hypothetical protein
MFAGIVSQTFFELHASINNLLGLITRYPLANILLAEIQDSMICAGCILLFCSLANLMIFFENSHTIGYFQKTLIHQPRACDRRHGRCSHSQSREFLYLQCVYTYKNFEEQKKRLLGGKTR